jgi:hypothetical protein
LDDYTDDQGDPIGTLYDPLETPGLDPADRWPASPGYQRYCTRAETRMLNHWVERQLTPVHQEHGRFFEQLDGHGSEDDPAVLFPPGPASTPG